MTNSREDIKFELPRWLMWLWPWSPETEADLERRSALTGSAKLSRSRSFLGGIIEVETTYELVDDPTNKTPETPAKTTD